MAWHGGSEFGHSSHFVAMDGNGRARWRFLATAARGRQLLTAADLDVALALLQHHGPTGRCDPSHATLARAAQVAERTVRDALARLRHCGLVEWTQRIVRTRQGARQTSSAFRLTLANLATVAGRLIRRRREGPEPGGGFRRGTSEDINSNKQKELDEMAEIWRRNEDFLIPKDEAQEALRRVPEQRERRAAAPAEPVALDREPRHPLTLTREQRIAANLEAEKEARREQARRIVDRIKAQGPGRRGW